MALGVVYGDIGTSPLYALRECFGPHGVPVQPSAVFGALSLIFWTLTSIVSVKHLLHVLRADNQGEGGILALMALSVSHERRHAARRVLLGWSPLRAAAVTFALLGIEGTFFAANLEKVEHGGWFPLVLAAGLLLLMTTWHRGRQLLAERFQRELLPLPHFFERLRAEGPLRVPGTAVFMTRQLHGAPPRKPRYMGTPEHQERSACPCTTRPACAPPCDKSPSSPRPASPSLRPLMPSPRPLPRLPRRFGPNTIATTTSTTTQ